jgi:hypothetical protein
MNGAGRRSRTPKTRRSADFESGALVKLAEELKSNTLAWLRNFHPELLKT